MCQIDDEHKSPLNNVDTPAIPFTSGEPFKDAGTDAIAKTIDELEKGLRELSENIHQHPEIRFEEKNAHDVLTKYMKDAGFEVTQHAHTLETAWEATFTHGNGGPVIGVNSEMDALPGLGHACGHNLIAVVGVATAVALARLLKANDKPGKIVILGTPAEEDGGGKIIMLDKGAYDKMDICMMAHPTPRTCFQPMQARSIGKFTFHGKPAHAAAAPHVGRNALDAAVIAYNSISMLRQQVLPTTRLHLNIHSATDQVINVIPSKAELAVAARALTMDEFKRVLKMVKTCGEAAAMSSGTTIEEEWDDYYSTLDHNTVMAAEYAKYMKTYEDQVIPWEADPLASTDFGNVTKYVPSIHPHFSIMAKDKTAVNHTHEFTELAGRPGAFTNAMSCAKGLTAVGWRAIVDESFLAEIKKAFQGREQGEKERKEVVDILSARSPARE